MRCLQDQCAEPLTTSPHPLSTAWFTEGTPYAGGYFKVKFSFNSEFPAAPPKCNLSLPYRCKPRAELSHPRLVRNQDISPERVIRRRDLRQHFEEGLEVILWHCPYTCDGQVSVDLS